MSCEVKVKIKLDPQFTNMLAEDIKKAAMLTIEEARDDITQSQTVPRDEGHMEDDAYTFWISSPPNITATLVYPAKYARYPYFGMTRDGKKMNYQTANNPYARSHWLEPYRDGVFLTEHFKKNLKKVREGG